MILRIIWCFKRTPLPPHRELITRAFSELNSEKSNHPVKCLVSRGVGLFLLVLPQRLILVDFGPPCLCRHCHHRNMGGVVGNLIYPRWHMFLWMWSPFSPSSPKLIESPDSPSNRNLPLIRNHLFEINCLTCISISHRLIFVSSLSSSPSSPALLRMRYK